MSLLKFLINFFLLKLVVFFSKSVVRWLIELLFILSFFRIVLEFVFLMDLKIFVEERMV